MTNPINEILPRELDPELKRILNEFSTIINEFVNFGTHVFKWVIEGAKGTDEQMPLLMFFRDMLEKTDSISLLIMNSSTDPSKVILRSIFELNLYINYLVEKNFDDRSMAFLTCNAIRKKQLNKNYDKSKPEFERIRKLLEHDILISDPNFLDDLPSVEPVLKSLNSLLNRQEYKIIVKEYERTKNKDHNNPEWYHLFNGPKNINELATYLKKPFLYELLYRKWSGSVHSTDIIQGKIVEKNGSLEIDGKVDTEIVQLRLPKDAQEVTAYTLLLLLNTFIVLRDTKIMEKNNEIKEWYLSIKQPLMKITQKARLINIDY
jgi:hypothetical protein